MKRKIKVVVNGLPGKMAWAVAEGVAFSDDMELLPYGLTGPEVNSKLILVGGETFRLFAPVEKSVFLSQFEEVGRPDVTIDFTAPDAVQENVAFYIKTQQPFVIGTTFGEFKHLPMYIKERVSQSMINAVQAVNMAKDVVLVQAMFEFAAQNFPDALVNFCGKSAESHQPGKGDTSGTAKAIVASLRALGVDCSIEAIKKNRNEDGYAALGIPKEHWDGHGWHTYSLTKNDGNVFLEFTHNINGRQPYVDGTLDAVRFLFKKMDTAAKNVGHVFSMIDVLKSV